MRVFVWLFLFCHERDEGQLGNEDCVTSMDANRWRSLLVVDGCVGLERMCCIAQMMLLLVCLFVGVGCDDRMALYEPDG